MFERALLQAIRSATRGLGVRSVHHRHSRILLDLGPDADWDQVKARLKEVFGIANFSLAYGFPPDLEAIKAGMARYLPVDGNTRTFAVRAARNDKSFPITSPEIQRELGAFVKARTGWGVDLARADLNIRVEIVPGAAYLSFDREEGAGGLPPGVSGTVACLLSGGIDSPVAAYRMMRRGAQVVYVHFHAFPVLWGVSRDKVQALLEVLGRYQMRSRLYLVPFAPLQQRLILSVPPRYRVVVYRRLMFRIAEAIARQEGAGALVTGESLGQVSSQTLQNLTTIQAATTMPVLRPLIGMDKLEIIQQARHIGTYDLSIEPDEDCCTLFVPKHPVTRSTPHEMEQIEASIDIEGLVRTGMNTAEVKRFTFEPMEEMPRVERVARPLAT
jgi:thiamine biosynthesis protein ThiI